MGSLTFDDSIAFCFQLQGSGLLAAERRREGKGHLIRSSTQWGIPHRALLAGGPGLTAMGALLLFARTA